MSVTIDYAYNAFSEERFPLPTKAQVAKLEKKIGIAFPDDYRGYLLEYNGVFFFLSPILRRLAKGAPRIG